MQISQPIPHVLIFPLPIQGPVNSTLKLAELLILSTNDIHITFLTTDHVYKRLALAVGNAQAAARFRQTPRFSIQTFSDGLPEDHPRGGQKFEEMLDATKSASHSVIKEMFTSGNGEAAFTCIIADGLYDFALDVGNEAKVPVIYFETMSPCCLWVYTCLPRLIEAGEVPITDIANLDALVNVVPGTEGFLRRRDLPDFCRARYDIDHMTTQDVLTQIKQFERAQGIIFNTFQDLDSNLLKHMRDHYKSANIYDIGPLHLHLHKRLEATKTTTFMQENVDVPLICSNSFYEEDNKCMTWLDKRAPKSVIYCSFGSQVGVTKQQLMEFWHGLVSSGCYFLWVKRPKSVTGMDDNNNRWSEEIDEELIDDIKKRGYIASWVPQEKVLGHKAVGGFLTHSGWNSTLESLAKGVPMICWPHLVDQLVISRFVSEVWKVGVDIKDTCDRVVIEKVVKQLMDNVEKNELVENASKWGDLARKAVDENGSSRCSLECLIEDIRSMKLFASKSHV